jgi:hypothetical protein
MFVEDLIIKTLIRDTCVFFDMVFISFLICSGVKLFDPKRLDPFFKFKRFLGLSLLLFAFRYILMSYFPLMYLEIK